MRRSVMIAAAAAVVAASVARADTKLVIGYGPASAWIPAFVAKDQGIFARHGIDASFQFIPIGSNEPAAMVAGTIEVGTLTPTILLFADEGGADLAAVAGAVVQTHDHPFGGLVARAGSGIHEAGDLRGKRVAVPGINSVMHVAFMKWLKDKGVDPKSVNFVETAMPQMKDVMQGGQIDAAVPVEPFLGGIVASKTGYMVSPFPADLAKPAYIDAFYAMTRAFIAADPRAVASFRAAIREATDWTQQHETEARRTQITYLHLPEPVAMSVALPNFTADITPAQLQFWADICGELGLTKGGVPVDTMVAQ
jgi:NitT/TauT family transport system substrate-binding protein